MNESRAVFFLDHYIENFPEFGCKINGKIISFLPYVLYEENRHTSSINISSQVFDCTPAEFIEVKRIYNQHRKQMELYFNLLIDGDDYPYPKQAIETLLDLPLTDAEKAKVYEYLNEFTFIYLIKDNFTGFTKIGFSKNPQARLQQLLKQDTLLPRPNDFSLIFYWEDYEYIERVLHNRFAHKRIRGEWFDLSNEDIEKIQFEFIF